MKGIINNLIENGVSEKEIAVSYSKGSKSIDIPKKIKDNNVNTI